MSSKTDSLQTLSFIAHSIRSFLVFFVLLISSTLCLPVNPILPSAPCSVVHNDYIYTFDGIQGLGSESLQWTLSRAKGPFRNNHIEWEHVHSDGKLQNVLFAQCVMIGAEMIVVGGMNSKRVTLSEKVNEGNEFVPRVQLYNIERGEWSIIRDGRLRFDRMKVGAVNETAVVAIEGVGGEYSAETSNHNSNFLNKGFIWNLEDNRVEFIPLHNIPLISFAGSVVIGKYLYIIGGMIRSDTGRSKGTRDIWKFDLTEHEWTLSDMSLDAEFVTIIAVGYKNESIFVLPGLDSFERISEGGLRILDITRNSTTIISNPTLPRWGHSMLVLGDQLVIHGGIYENGDTLCDIHILNIPSLTRQRNARMKARDNVPQNAVNDNTIQVTEVNRGKKDETLLVIGLTATGVIAFLCLAMRKKRLSIRKSKDKNDVEPGDMSTQDINSSKSGSSEQKGESSSASRNRLRSLLRLISKQKRSESSTNSRSSSPASPSQSPVSSSQPLASSQPSTPLIEPTLSSPIATSSFHVFPLSPYLTSSSSNSTSSYDLQDHLPPTMLSKRPVELITSSRVSHFRLPSRFVALQKKIIQPHVNQSVFPRLFMLFPNPGVDPEDVFNPKKWNTETFGLYLLCEGLSNDNDGIHMPALDEAGYGLDADPLEFIRSIGPYISIISDLMAAILSADLYNKQRSAKHKPVDVGFDPALLNDPEEDESRMKRKQIDFFKQMSEMLEDLTGEKKLKGKKYLKTLEACQLPAFEAVGKLLKIEWRNHKTSNKEESKRDDVEYEKDNDSESKRDREIEKKGEITYMCGLFKVRVSTMFDDIPGHSNVSRWVCEKCRSLHISRTSKLKSPKK
ncbi:8735_t:CDS:1 [Paraglomus brasilianum]|uniref:8735_t:CDS:1 n=1 Tax=Paraglomus brasilianum TaxID=144538 RepID=A0A9N8WIL4_9GLOM|nr:8735_t:CDS:1 [Paraglomus brasilianum]